MRVEVVGTSRAIRERIVTLVRAPSKLELSDDLIVNILATSITVTLQIIISVGRYRRATKGRNPSGFDRSSD